MPPSPAVPYAGPERRHDGDRLPIPNPLPSWWPLTPAETRVAELVASGHTHQATADLLGIRYVTVVTHMKHIGMRLPGQGTPTDRLRALLVRVALHTQAHPGETLPESLLRRVAA